MVFMRLSISHFLQAIWYRILRSIPVQFQDMHVAIHTLMSLSHLRQNTGIAMCSGDDHSCSDPVGLVSVFFTTHEGIMGPLW